MGLTLLVKGVVSLVNVLRDPDRVDWMQRRCAELEWNGDVVRVAWYDDDGSRRVFHHYSGSIREAIDLAMELDEDL